MTLRNNTQICYANSIVLCFYWAVCATTCTWQHGFGRLHKAFKALLNTHRPTITSFAPLKTLWQGWPDAHIQHDAAEFWAHLLQVSAPSSCEGSWQARAATEEGVRITDSGTMKQALMTPLEVQPQAQSISVCIDRWRNQHGLQIHALVEAPTVLCLQLNRFQVSGRRVTKTKTPVHIPQVIAVPRFVDDSLDVHLMRYRPVAAVAHHGATPLRGHYTSVAWLQEGYHLMDDNRVGKRVGVIPKALSCDIYLIWLVQIPDV